MCKDAIAWAHLNGLVVGQGDGVSDVTIVHAPISLLPTPFPAAEFQLVQRSMPLFNQLVDAVSLDHEYLQGTLAQAAMFDDFMASLLGVFEDTKNARAQHASPIALGIHRSDYMLDAPSNSLLQVELNTIAASFGCLSTLVSRMHRHLISRHPAAVPVAAEQLPEQGAMGGLAEALASAHAAHRELHPSDGGGGGVVVMVVQPGERNAYDQQWLQLTLWDEHRVPVARATMRDIAQRGSIDTAGNLTLDGKRVTVFYLRAGYAPTDYPSEAEWDARRMMESCNAVSCPSVAYQLVGAKKVQQDLAVPGRLERFVQGSEDRSCLRSCFAGLWSLDGSEQDTEAIVEMALAEPDDYVLKPQREGGGNNLYGDAMVAKLKEGKGLASYILMQRIRPPVNQSILIRKGQAVREATLSELGIYGTYLRVDGEVRLNKCVGHLLRTKTATSNEGGVAAGFAVLDSPYLV